MARTFDALNPTLRSFVEAQHVFFVATAPLSGDGHVNLSPKGGDTFRVLDDSTVAYLDLTGSGAETIAHTRENGRITVLFTALDGPPQLVRLWGRGEAVLAGAPRFAELVARFPDLPGTRAVVVVDVEQVGTSCGYGVPRYAYEGERTRMVEWAESRGPEGVAEYQATTNAFSKDGLPAMAPAGDVPS